MTTKIPQRCVLKNKFKKVICCLQVMILFGGSACAQQGAQQIEDKHMQSQPAIQTSMTAKTANKAITFNEHELSTFCYSASEMKVRYGRFSTGGCKKIGRAKTPKDEKRFPGASILGLPAFLGPLDVQWISKDGESLQAFIDLAEIFPGKVVLHQEDHAQLEETLPLISPPTIVVEVNDRTLSIYMDAWMGMHTEEPSRIRKASRNYTLAFQRTY